MIRHAGSAALFAFVGVMALAPNPIHAREPVVVELFTSQGCSSCPPADAFLDELAGRADILALSLHVDYWNYLGWADPFSQRSFSERQRAYRDAMGLRYVYTPQIVVDGAAEGIGSDRPEIERLIASQHDKARLAVTLTPTPAGEYVARLPQGSGRGTVWFVEFDRSHKTAVPRGENAGRALVNANVVRSWRKIGEWTGAAAEFSLGLPQQSLPGGCAVIVQEKTAGRVLGAAVVRWDKRS